MSSRTTRYLYYGCGWLTVAIVKVMNLIGDVKGKVAVMVDDMIDTAGKWDYGSTRTWSHANWKWI